ncbi:MAG: ATP-dependent Clp protease adapter ClpS [Desulfobulbaceae bacterium]|nr:ATP-dependent Clp protease adapter ClpS [Desulfobulbaceae bacterium]
MAKDRTSFEKQKQVQDQEELKEPSLYKVLLHNDDYTTMDFVIMVLETVFHKDSTEATRIMLNVHNQGVGIAGVYTREIGETKIGIVHDMARKNQYPLKCSLEKVNM